MIRSPGQACNERLPDISHELRLPLARLSVALELSREGANATMSTHLARMEHEIERLNQRIGQLLALSSMEAAERLDKFERLSQRLQISIHQ